MPYVQDEFVAYLKYQEIKDDFDSLGLLAFAVQGKHFATESEARDALDGLEQWLACHLHPTDAKSPMVMLRSPVALMFDVMVLSGQYEGFCRRYFGAPIKRHNVDVKMRNDLTNQDAVPFMLTRIQSAFGDECATALQAWISDPQPQMLFVTSTDKPLAETCYLVPVEKTA